MNDVTKKIQKRLFELQDEGYQKFHAKLVPNINPDTVIGVRAPLLKQLAREVAKWPDIDLFLQDVPHTYYDENVLHMRLIGGIKEFDKCLAYTKQFLPYIDNWAVCDVSLPKVFFKNKKELLAFAYECLKSKHPYTIRYGTNILMGAFLDEDFDTRQLQKAAQVSMDDYYVKMGIAWYFATALAKQYDRTIPFIQQKKLEDWTHKKAIQKAVESYRITPEQKAYLKTLK